MRLDDESESQNVEDRRGGGGFRVGRGTIGIGTIVVALAASYFLGIDPMLIINGASVLQGNAPQHQAAPSNQPPANDEGAVFVRRVLGNTERTWQQIFRTQFEQDYPAPKLVLFTGGTQTACGMGQAAMGPFYCPADRNVYIDLSFYRELRERFGAGGDFAQAYVIAHEVGHHVQNVLGISSKVDSARSRMSRERANELSVRVELQADCFAGVWGNKSQAQLQWLHEGDVEAALNAAAQVGDDTLQKQSRGYVVPDSFTHGTAAQRAKWFKAGFQSGDITSCNTFAAPTL
jgi:predicted metalloprotease